MYTRVVGCQSLCCLPFLFHFIVNFNGSSHYIGSTHSGYFCFNCSREQGVTGHSQEPGDWNLKARLDFRAKPCLKATTEHWGKASRFVNVTSCSLCPSRWPFKWFLTLSAPKQSELSFQRPWAAGAQSARLEKWHSGRSQRGSRHGTQGHVVVWGWFLVDKVAGKWSGCEQRQREAAGRAEDHGSQLSSKGFGHHL